MLLREPARPAAVREHHLAPWLAVATVCFGAFMGQLDASIVTLAFPALQRQFGVGLAGVQWVSPAGHHGPGRGRPGRDVGRQPTHCRTRHSPATQVRR
jgi:hypothetical protein